MCEAIAQVGAIAVLTDERFAGKLPLFGGLDGARFRRQVGPGDALTLEVELGGCRPAPARARGRALLGGASVACSCDLLFVVVDADRSGRRRPDRRRRRQTVRPGRGSPSRCGRRSRSCSTSSGRAPTRGRRR